MQNINPHEPLHPETRILIHETISIRAYGLWEKHGHRWDDALDNWLQAEREFLAGPRPRRSNSGNSFEAEKN